MRKDIAKVQQEAARQSEQVSFAWVRFLRGVLMATNLYEGWGTQFFFKRACVSQCCYRSLAYPDVCSANDRIFVLEFSDPDLDIANASL